jgi:hypothetical protein
MSEQRRATAHVGIPKPVSEMSDKEKLDTRKKVLEHLEKQAASGNENNLSVEIKADEWGYEGKISLRRPSIDEERKIGVRTAAYLEGKIGVDVKTENLCIFLASFDVCCDWKNAPEWWNPREMPGSDYELLEFVYGRFAEWLQSFRQRIRRQSQGDSEAPAVAQ